MPSWWIILGGGGALLGGGVWWLLGRRAPTFQTLWPRIMERTPVAFMLTDARGVIRAVNPAFTAITGYDQRDVVGKTPKILHSGRHDAAFYREFWSHLRHEGQWQGEIWNRRKGGQVYPEWLSVTAVRDRKGRVAHYAAIFSDINEVMLSNERIAHLAFHDALTGLPNRLLFQDRMNQAISRGARSAHLVALLFVDLDDFKTINDRFGHAVGDLVLKSFAERLRSSLRTSDTIARIGGDEFAVLLEGVAGVGQAIEKAQALVSTHAVSFKVGGAPLHVSASVGIALHPEHARSGEELIRMADTAMYQAKHAGKNRFVIYDPRSGSAPAGSTNTWITPPKRARPLTGPRGW